MEVVKHSAIKGGADGAAPLLIIKFQSDKSADEVRGPSGRGTESAASRLLALRPKVGGVGGEKLLERN